MIEYKLVHSHNFGRLENDVNEKLRRGWKLQGGIAIGINSQTGTVFYVQALVKED